MSYLIVVDKGRNVGEKSVLLIEDDKFKGFCFTDLEYQINNLKILKSLISPMKNSNYNRNKIRNMDDITNFDKLIINLSSNEKKELLEKMENAENGDGTPETRTGSNVPLRSKRFLTFGIKRLAVPEIEIREYLT